MLAFLPYLLALPTIIAFYWLFRQPEQVFAPGKKRTAVKFIALVYLIIALAPLLNGERAFSHLFFAYPLLYAVLYRQQILGLLGKSAQRGIGLFAAIFFLLWFNELFVVLDYGGSIAVHLNAYIGFYLGLALVFTRLRRWNHSFAQLFTMGGIWGVIIE